MSVTSSLNNCNRQCVIVLAITKEDLLLRLYISIYGIWIQCEQSIAKHHHFCRLQAITICKTCKRVSIIKYSMWVVINLLTCACTSQWRQKPRCILVESYYILLQFLLIKVVEWPRTRHPPRIGDDEESHLHLNSMYILLQLNF